MSQSVGLRALDQRIFACLQGANLADSALYVPSTGGDPILCSVYVDRDVQTFGDVGQVIGSDVQITFFNAEVSPLRGDMVTIDPDGSAEVFILESLVSGFQDESRSKWTLAKDIA
ncbi:MAG: hypothetical protein ABI120_17475 [Gemmatimonadaceae bacterium]